MHAGCLIAGVPALFFPAVGAGGAALILGQDTGCIFQVTVRLRQVEHGARVVGMLLQRLSEQAYVAGKLIGPVAAVAQVGEGQLRQQTHGPRRGSVQVLVRRAHVGPGVGTAQQHGLGVVERPS